MRLLADGREFSLRNGHVFSSSDRYCNPIAARPFAFERRDGLMLGVVPA